jgi:hypothetical protein
MNLKQIKHAGERCIDVRSWLPNSYKAALPPQAGARATRTHLYNSNTHTGKVVVVS